MQSKNLYSWLRVKALIRGVGVFQGQSYADSMLRICKAATTPQMGLFAKLSGVHGL